MPRRSACQPIVAPLSDSPAKASPDACAAEGSVGPTSRTAVARLILGKGCLHAWLLIMLFSPVIHGASMANVTRLGNVTMAWCLGFIAISLIGALPWQRLRAHQAPAPAAQDGQNVSRRDGSPREAAPTPSLRTARLTIVGAGVVLCACTLLLEIGDPVTHATWWVPAASVLSGAGSAVQCWCWGRLFTARYSRLTGVYVSMAFTVAALALTFVATLPPLVATLATAALPLASATLFVTDRPPSLPHGAQSLTSPDGTAAHPRATFGRALAGVALLGFSESFSRMLFQAPGAVTDPIYPLALLFATLIAAIVVSLVSLARLERDSIGRVNHALMLIMALLFALMPALQGLGLATDTANLVCRVMFYLIIEVLFAQVCFIHGLNVLTSYALGFGIANTGCLVGILLGRQLAPVVAVSFRLQVVFAVLCAVLVFAAFLFVVDERTFVELLHAKDASRPQARRFALRCDHVAQEHRLTAKETEVMVLAAKGNTAQRIAEALGISVGTVNVHLNHAYRKMGVHSRQEMIDLIEAAGDAETPGAVASVERR